MIILKKVLKNELIAIFVSIVAASTILQDIYLIYCYDHSNFIKVQALKKNKLYLKTRIFEKIRCINSK